MLKPTLPEGMSLSICGPWMPVTWTPWCSFREDGGQGPCAAPCKEASALRMANEEDPTVLWLKGNTTLLEVEREVVERVAKEAVADRLVWSEELPG